MPTADPALPKVRVIATGGTIAGVQDAPGTLGGYRAGTRTVGEIVGNFNLSQPTISRHLSVLKEADLVVDQRQGQNVIYRLNDMALSNSMQEFFGQFRSCQEVLR